MSLAELWSTSRAQLENKLVHQIIAFAGTGQLADGSSSVAEFPEFLGIVPSSHLSRYADECLRESFTGNGFALQDVVNQIGRRLGYSVVDGRYRGTSNQIGFDGLWKFPDGHTVVVEVKTTDTYRIDLQRLADYRRDLITENRCDEEHSSILIVVGRQDTGDLEAQIRGSRHAWDVRLISVDALLRLMFLKERVDDPATIRRICDILKPREFTRLDEIVDVVFSATEEAAEPEAAAVENETDTFEERATPVAFHGACIARIEQHLGKRLVRQTRSSYATPDHTIGIVCAVAKTHEVVAHPSYWFAFHTYQKTFLESAQGALLVLGCGSAKTVLAIPAADLFMWLPDMWTTERNGSFYWHIRVHQEGTRYTWDRKGGLGRIDVTRYLLPDVLPNEGLQSAAAVEPSRRTATSRVGDRGG
jgi:hypothetical protein